jgi:hypothetical protein
MIEREAGRIWSAVETVVASMARQRQGNCIANTCGWRVGQEKPINRNLTNS